MATILKVRKAKISKTGLLQNSLVSGNNTESRFVNVNGSFFEFFLSNNKNILEVTQNERNKSRLISLSYLVLPFESVKSYDIQTKKFLNLINMWKHFSR